MNLSLLANPKPMNVRTFLHNFSQARNSDEPILVMNRQKEEGVFVPYDQWQRINQKRPRYIPLEELRKFQFHGGDPDMSKNIDDIYNL